MGSRSRAFLVALAAVGVLSLVLGTAPVLADMEPADAEALCGTDVIFVGARGAGEAFNPGTEGDRGMGSRIGPMFEGFRDAAPGGITVAAAPADADYAPVEDLPDAPTTGYDDATDAGADDVASTIEQLEDCAEAPGAYVLAGFSQGADAARRAIAQLDDPTRDRVAGVVLAGDPWFDRYADGGRVLGDSHEDACLTLDCTQAGIFTNAAPDDRPGISGTLGDRTHQWCLEGDVVCDAPADDADSRIHDAAYQLLARTIGENLWSRSGFSELGDDGGEDGPAPSGEGVGSVLIIDSSGSMSGDRIDRAIGAGKSFLSASTASDLVGVVDFDGSARSPSHARNPVSERDELENALDEIVAGGSTNLNAGLTKGCEVLEEAPSRAAKGALFFNDGTGTYTDGDQCYIDNGWPVYTFGLGSGVDDEDLQTIADNTGGTYTPLDNVDNLICEFQQVRAAIAGQEPGDCEPTGTIDQDETVQEFVDVADRLRQITFTNLWPGSDIEMTLVTPSGERISRDTDSPRVSIDHGGTFEIITVLDPEGGEWTVELFGADVDEGEPFTLSTVPVPAENDLPVADFTATPSGLDVAFDASASNDPDGTILAHLWSFGDGTYDAGVAPSHTYAAAGTYDVSLSVLDDDFEWTSTTVPVIVSEPSRDSGGSSGGDSDDGDDEPEVKGVTVDRGQGTPSLRGGYLIMGEDFEVTAPPTTSDDPHVLEFRLDRSSVPPARDPLALNVYRDGMEVPDCDDDAGDTASPDPCVASILFDGGDIVVTVHTSAASTWTFSYPIGACPRVADVAFRDIEGSVHAMPIRCIAEWNVTTGTTPTTYGPAEDVTTGQMASFVSRVLKAFGTDLPLGGNVRLTGPSVHGDSIGALVSLGVIDAGDGAFDPGRPLLREEMAAWMVRAHRVMSDVQLPAASDRFDDDADSAYEADINTAAAAGFTRGVTDTAFDPSGHVTRDQMASFLVNLLDPLVTGGWFAR